MWLIFLGHFINQVVQNSSKLILLMIYKQVASLRGAIVW